jgi:acetyltransferase-like isoleucine patch superfamily enzyme
VVGAGSIVLPGVEIGEGSVVGALSLVKSTLEPWGIHAGVPARRLRERGRDLVMLERELLASEAR